MKRKISYAFLARHIVDGKCAASVQRATAKQAVDDLGEVSGGTVEVFRLEFRLHPIGKWWSEVNRVRVEGDSA